MKAYDETTYGSCIAAAYDDLYPDYEPAAIDVLAELAGEGVALELGIGTGQVALPLAERGVEIFGVDASEEMLEALKSKPQSADIVTIMGSFAEFKIERRFSLIYVVFNTFFTLLTLGEQVRCFQTVAEHLAPDGVFLIEAFVPALGRFDGHQTVRATEVTRDTVHLEVSKVDPVNQQVTSQHVLHSEQGTRLYPVKLRYAWPAELDLMAQLAGLSRRERWGSWRRDTFTKDSMKHISIFDATQ
jgi:SAM-dependent methyltransferase